MIELNITPLVLEELNIKPYMNMMHLASIEVYEHSLRVAQYTEIALSYVLSKEDHELKEEFSKYNFKDVIRGALLHDVGKILLPFNITTAERRFSEIEKKIVEIHPILSYEVTNNVFNNTVTDICLKHHNRINGRGYPLVNDRNLNKIIELIGIIDIFDALISKRAYKKSLDNQRAKTIIREEYLNDNFSEDIFKLFCEIENLLINFNLSSKNINEEN